MLLLLVLLVGADGALGLEGGVLPGGELQRQHLSHVHRGWAEGGVRGGGGGGETEGVSKLDFCGKHLKGCG